MNANESNRSKADESNEQITEQLVDEIDGLNYYGVTLSVTDINSDGDITVALYKDNSARDVQNTRIFYDTGKWQCVMGDNGYAVLDEALGMLNESGVVPADEDDQEPVTDGGRYVEYRVISDVDGYVTEYGDRDAAEKRAEELDEEFPGQTHRVEKKEFVMDGGTSTEAPDDQATISNYVVEAAKRAEDEETCKNENVGCHGPDGDRFPCFDCFCEAREMGIEEVLR